jgi:hypothetical protein
MDGVGVVGVVDDVAHVSVPSRRERVRSRFVRARPTMALRGIEAREESIEGEFA